MAEVSQKDTTVVSNKRGSVASEIEETGKKLDSMQGNIIYAPHSLAILGQVMLLSTRSDFSLISKPVPDGSKDVKFFEGRGDFRYVTHPESFRATLVQVSILSFIILVKCRVIINNHFHSE